MKRTAMFLLGALGAACQDRGTPTSPVEPPSFLIVDGANSNGNPDFFFLPPVVRNPVRNPNFERDEFNPNLMPVVRICNGGTCPVEEPAELQGDHYQFNWMTNRADAGKILRVRVLVGMTELGLFDAQLVQTGAQLRQVPPYNVGVVAGSTLPVNFRIENGALCDPPGTKPCASETVNLAQGGDVVLETGDRIDIPAQEETQQTTTVTVQLCDDLNPRVLDLPTFGNCIRITADPPLEQALDVAAIVSACTLDLGMLGLSEEQEDLVTLHRLDPGPVVKALPHTTDNCALNVGRAAPEESGLPRLALALWRRLAAIAAPRPLQASMSLVLDRGGGGQTLNFSDFQFALPAKLEKVAGDGQSAAPGTAVAVAPKVKVTDRNNDPVAGARVTFEIGEGEGSVNSTMVQVLTDADGFAAVTQWILGEEPGTNTLRASGRGIAKAPTAPFMPEISQPPSMQMEVNVPLSSQAQVFTAQAVADGEPEGMVLYGVNSADDGLSTISVATGDVTFIGQLDPVPPNQFETPVAMAVRPSDHTIFVWNNSGVLIPPDVTTTGRLLTVDVCTGLGTMVAPATVPQGILGALAFAPNGTLFGLTGDQLDSIRVTTAVRVLVGFLGLDPLANIAAADFDGDGTLYGVELIGAPDATPERLVTINTATGAANVVGTLDANIGAIGSIVFDPSGALIGSGFGGPSGNIIFDIDPSNGHVSNIRTLTGGTAPQGMGFAPPCPEP